MFADPEIVELPASLLCGFSAPMSLQNFAPWTLWPRLMPLIPTMGHRATSDLISLRTFKAIPVFGPTADPSFTYWAGAEVLAPMDGLEHLELPGGTYAVFHYKGRSTDSTIWRYIYSQWIPNSAWELDDRPHFERLGAKYKNDDPDSEELIYIPIRPRA